MGRKRLASQTIIHTLAPRGWRKTSASAAPSTAEKRPVAAGVTVGSPGGRVSNTIGRVCALARRYRRCRKRGNRADKPSGCRYLRPCAPGSRRETPRIQRQRNDQREQPGQHVSQAGTSPMIPVQAERMPVPGTRKARPRISRHQRPVGNSQAPRFRRAVAKTCLAADVRRIWMGRGWARPRIGQVFPTDSMLQIERVYAAL